ncbi:MAG: hypothetical protein KAU58_03955, partial [Candidatus Omnitrophica bacterium]|nr:hypothetical protein [Candidatus Omnitrophota bacterium]
MKGQRWEEGLAQAVEAKEALDIQAESKTTSKISIRDILVNEYAHFSGLSGTVTEAKKELRKLFGKEVVAIPSHYQQIRGDNPTEIVLTEKDKFAYIIDRIKSIREGKSGAPILVTFREMKVASDFYDMLIKEGMATKDSIQLLDASKESVETKIIDTAGTPGMITVATNMAGRATDIKLLNKDDILEEAEKMLAKEKVEKLDKLIDELNADRNPETRKEKINSLSQFFESLDVDISKLKDMVFTTYVHGLQLIREVNKSLRVDRQADGRIARQDNPGEAWSVLSLEGQDIAILEKGLYYSGNLLDRMKFKNILKFKEILQSKEGLTDSQEDYIRKAIRRAQNNIDKMEFKRRAASAKLNTFEYKMQKVYHEIRNSILINENKTITQSAILEMAVSKLTEKYKTGEITFQEMLEVIKSRFGISLEGVAEEFVKEIDNNSLKEVIFTAVENNISQNDLRSVVTQAIDDIWVEFLVDSKALRKEVRYGKYARKTNKAFTNLMNNFTDRIVGKLTESRESKAESLDTDIVNKALSEAEQLTDSYFAKDKKETIQVEETKPGILDRTYNKLFGPRVVQVMVSTDRARQSAPQASYVHTIESADSEIQSREAKTVDISGAVNEAIAKKDRVSVKITDVNKTNNTAVLSVSGKTKEKIYVLPKEVADYFVSEDGKAKLTDIIESKNLYIMNVKGHHVIIGYRDETTFVIGDLGKAAIGERIISQSPIKTLTTVLKIGVASTLLATPLIGWLTGMGFITFGGLIASKVFGLSGTLATITGGAINVAVTLPVLSDSIGKISTTLMDNLSMRRKIDSAIGNLLSDINMGVNIDQKKAIYLALADLVYAGQKLHSGEITAKEAMKNAQIAIILDDLLKKLFQAEQALALIEHYETALNRPDINDKAKQKMQKELKKLEAKGYEDKKQEALKELNDVYQQLRTKPAIPKLETLSQEINANIEKGNKLMAIGKRLSRAASAFETALQKYEEACQLDPKLAERNKDLATNIQTKIQLIEFQQMINPYLEEGIRRWETGELEGAKALFEEALNEFEKAFKLNPALAENKDFQKALNSLKVRIDLISNIIEEQEIDTLDRVKQEVFQLETAKALEELFSYTEVELTEEAKQKLLSAVVMANNGELRDSVTITLIESDKGKILLRSHTHPYIAINEREFMADTVAMLIRERIYEKPITEYILERGTNG